jgi:hypothetical protein
MPRRGAPQGQGPGSAAAAWRETPATAKTDKSLSTRLLAQFRQVTSVAVPETIFSNLAPHSRQRYSKMGMRVSLSQLILLFQYNRGYIFNQEARIRLRPRQAEPASQPHFFWLF